MKFNKFIDISNKLGGVATLTSAEIKMISGGQFSGVPALTGVAGGASAPGAASMPSAIGSPNALEALMSSGMPDWLYSINHPVTVGIPRLLSNGSGQ